METAEGGNVSHALVPKFGCLISRIGNVVSIFCHLAQLGISEGQPQKPMCPCLEGMPMQGLYMWFAFNCLRVNEQRGKGKQRLRTTKRQHSRVPCHRAPKVTHCQRFLLWASCILPCLLYNHTVHLDVQHRPATPCIGNATAWIYDLTTYAASCFCLPQHVQKITPLARKKLWSNGYLY